MQGTAEARTLFANHSHFNYLITSPPTGAVTAHGRGPPSAIRPTGRLWPIRLG